MKQQYKILMSYFMKTKGWIVLISLFSASGCGVFDPTQIHTRLICLADLSRGLILGDSKFMKTRHGPWFLAVFYVMGITSFQAFGIGLGTEHTEQ